MQGSQARPVHRPARAAFAAAACCLLAAVWPSGRTAHAAPAGTLGMSPASAMLDIGDTVDVAVELSDGDDVNEVYLLITYDPAVLQAVDADGGTPGHQALPGAFPGSDSDPDTEGFVEDNAANNTSGTLEYRYALSGTAEAAGNGTVVTIEFEAIGGGDAALAFVTKTLRDGAGVPATPAGGAAEITVAGAATATATATATPTQTSATSPTATRTPSATRTGTAVATQDTATATPTVTAQITILQNSNAPTPPVGNVPRHGVDPSQAERANGLPDAGTEGPGLQLWRWSIFAAALLLGFAGWFFTFALHRGDREPVLMDRFDRRRRR